MVQNRNSYYNQVKAVPTNELVPIKQDIEKLDEKVTNVEAKVDELSNQVITECVIADNVTVNQKLTADNIETYTVKSNTFTGNSAEIDAIDATTVEADEVKATDASFSNLTVANKVNELSVGTLHTDTFSPTNISTNTVTADTVTTDTVNSDNVVTEKLQVTDKATIDNADIETATVMNGDIHSLSSDTITVREITADKTASTEVDANIVKSTVAEFTRSTIDSIKTHTISTNGKLNADPQGETHYSIDVPNYDNALVQLSGVYSTNDKWSVNILKAKNTAYISASETTLDGILDISYDDGKLRLRVKSDGIVNYSLYVNEENPAPLTISPLGDHYMPYYYVPEKLNTYTLLGYDDTTSQFYIPGTLKVYQLTAEYVSYERLAVVELRADRLELPKTHDSGGGVSEYSYGNARDYVSVSDDELVNEYHTPIEHATNGALSNSTCLIAESAITEYDGSRTVENVTTYPITHLGDSSVVHGKLAVEDDTVIDGTVAIKGDLWVDGTTHTVDEEEVVSQADTITLRANNNSSLGSNLSGLVINKYNGTDDLGIVADSDGTLRVGTGTGTETCYPTISYDYVNNKWYTDPEDLSTEVTPVGNLTSWASKEKAEPFTTYTDAVFTLFDKTTLEPVMTRDESQDMTDGQIVCWDCVGNKARTTNCICDNVTFAKCINVECNATIDCNATVCGTVSTPHLISHKIDICTPATTPGGTDGGCICGWDATFDNSMLICGDLRVCGSAIIHGLTSDCVAVQANSSDHEMYPSFVCRNNELGQQGELLYTDGDLHYNPSTNTMTVPKQESTCIHSKRVIADCDVTAGCVITDRIYSPQAADTATEICLLNHKADNTNETIAKTCTDGQMYQKFKYDASSNSNFKIPFTGLTASGTTGSLSGLTSMNVANGFYYNSQSGYLTVPSGICATGGRSHFDSIDAYENDSCFCGICTKYDILMFCDDWDCQTAYIYCDGSFCFSSDDNPHMLTGGTFIVNEPSCLSCSATVTGSLNLVGPVGSQLTIHNTAYSQTYAFCQGSNGFRLLCNGNIQGYWADGTYYGNVSGTTTTARRLCAAETVGVGECGAMIWNSYTGDSYGICTNNWRHYISVSHGNYDTCYGISFAMPFWENQRFAWRVRNVGNLCPIHELIDSRGGQTINGNVTLGGGTLNAFGGAYSVGTHTAIVKAYSTTTNYGYNGGAYIGHYNPNYDDYWGWAEFGFYNAESGGVSPGVYVNRSGYVCIPQSIDVANCVVVRNSTGLSLCNPSTGGWLWLSQSSVAVGTAEYCAPNCQAVAIGGCGTYAGGLASVAIGSHARTANNLSIAIGNSTAVCYLEGIAIGNRAVTNAAATIAIGNCACTDACGAVSIGLDIKAGSMRLLGISWPSGAYSCDVYNAINNRINLQYTGRSYCGNSTMWHGAMGDYNGHEITHIRWDCNESPLNIDFSTPGDIIGTVCAGSTNYVCAGSLLIWHFVKI